MGMRMFSDKEFEFKCEWEKAFRKPGDTFWIALNPVKSSGRRIIGDATLVTHECSSIGELEAEVVRLKDDLDAALADARTTLASWER